uniref:SRCR domain-containing protein n=1 Tax=Caenorhabditis tropicalis TaxID=1561998 RepID=A0A1I7TNA9_9PELO
MKEQLFSTSKIEFAVVGATCPCDGITLDESDQEHCWQIQSRSDSSWHSADDSCISVGGHLGFPLDSNFATIVSYAQKQSSLPVLTGIVAGNTEIPVIGAMCQSNVFYQMIDNTTSLLENEPTSTTTCSYIKSSASALVFDSCSIEANILCDRPLEKQDYCSIMANCTSTTTLLTTTTAISSTTANISLTSSTTQFYSSSLGTGETTTATTTTKIGQSSTTVSTTKGGSGSGGGSGSDSSSTPATCKCDGVSTTTSKTPITSGSCPEQSGCLKHQWKIFGMCVDWRAMLALLGILLAIFLCCCFCHCLYITVPEKHESVYGFHTKEIIHLMPERPMTRDVATMTDAEPELPPFMPVPTQAPVMKRKKAVKKPKKMFIPATADPMNSIEEDIGAEIPIEMPESPGARSVAPLGDVVDPVPMVPLNFSRNPKPMMPEPKIHDDIPLPRQVGGQNSTPAPQQRKPNIPNEEFDPSGLRSPPIPPAGNPKNGTPKRMTFSPIADESEEESGARIPSPPREPKASGGRPRNDGGSNAAPEIASEPRPTLKNQRLNEMPSPTPAKNSPAPSKSPASGASNNPFANLGGPSNDEGDSGAGRSPNDDVGMRAARGKLGGAVRGGGGGGEAPSGWKPWAKGGARR